MVEPQANQPTAWRQWSMGLVLLAFAGSVAHAESRVINRAVASIEGRVITSSQLEFEARVLLVNAGGTAAAFAPLDAEALESGLRAIVDQRLALLEADKLEAYSLEPGELERAIASFRARFGDEASFARFLEAHEADLADLAEVLRRALRSQRALEGKLKLRAQVSEADARAFQLSHPETRQVSLANVRAMLTQQRFDQLVKKELADQRRQTDVRFLGPFAPRPK